MKSIVLTLGIALLASTQVFSQLTSDTGVEQFTETDDLDEEALIEYLLVKAGVTYASLVPLTNDVTVSELKRKAVSSTLKKLEKHFGGKPPYDAYEVEDFMYASSSKESPALNIEIAGVTVPKSLGDIDTNGKSGSVGPFLLRSAPEDVGSRKKAGGATLQFSSNNINGDDRWTSKGALIYPVFIEDPSFEESSFLRSASITMGPALYWNVIDSSGSPQDDIEELQFSVPFVLGTNLKRPRTRAILTALPYYHTDWDFDGETIGITLSLETIVPGSLPLGKYVGFGFSDSNSDLDATLAHRIRIIPKIDYSEVRSAGGHSARSEGDDWFRAGAKIEYGLRFFGKDSPLEFSASYEFLNGFRNTTDYSDMIVLSATRWFQEQQIGLTLEYRRGETPISDKEIDLFTAGLELKF